MNSTHTPGPWRIGDAGAVIFGPKTDKPSPVTVAAVGRAGGDPDQARANARLISAAPELLAALVRLTNVAVTINAIQHSGAAILPEDWSDLHQISNEARAAIAKATGN